MAKKVKKSQFSFTKWLGDYLLVTLKQKAFQALFKKLFGAAAKVAGLKLWVTRLIIEVLWDHIGEPVAKYAIRKGLLFHDKFDGRIKIRRLKEARESKDAHKYNVSIDDIFS